MVYFHFDRSNDSIDDSQINVSTLVVFSTTAPSSQWTFDAPTTDHSEVFGCPTQGYTGYQICDDYIVVLLNELTIRSKGFELEI